MKMTEPERKTLEKRNYCQRRHAKLYSDVVADEDLDGCGSALACPFTARESLS